MNPIFNQMFSDDYRRFVLQEQQNITVHYVATPKLKFSVSKSEKGQKSKKKEDSPWLPKKPKKKDEDI